MPGHDASLIEVDGPWTHRAISAGRLSIIAL